MRILPHFIPAIININKPQYKRVQRSIVLRNTPRDLNQNLIPAIPVHFSNMSRVILSWKSSIAIPFVPPSSPPHQPSISITTTPFPPTKPHRQSHRQHYFPSSPHSPLLSSPHVHSRGAGRLRPGTISMAV